MTERMSCDTCKADITEEGISWDGGRWCSHRCSQVHQLGLFAAGQESS